MWTHIYPALNPVCGDSGTVWTCCNMLDPLHPVCDDSRSCCNVGTCNPVCDGSWTVQSRYNDGTHSILSVVVAELQSCTTTQDPTPDWIEQVPTLQQDCTVLLPLRVPALQQLFNYNCCSAGTKQNRTLGHRSDETFHHILKLFMSVAWGCDTQWVCGEATIIRNMGREGFGGFTN